MSKLKFVYHVVYMSEGNTYGSCTLLRKNKLANPSELIEARDYISKEFCKGKNVIIQNFILLNSRGVDK